MVYDVVQEGGVTSYTIGKLAKMAGVSVRTLHHYDQIGLLAPSARTESDYRLYGEAELLRLQQILFFRELDLALSEISRILDDPSFDPLQALHEHRLFVQAQVERQTRLLRTIDQTILRLTGENMGMTNEELYEGFTKDQAERYPREAREMYDPEVVAESERRVRRMSKAQWNAVKAEGDEVNRALAAMMDRDPGDAEVQELVARHHAWLKHFWTASAEQYRALGQGYAQHPEFRAFYDRYRPGLADFLAAAMAHYADETLRGSEGRNGPSHP